MTLCPIALAVGCQKCPVFKICPLKSVIGDQPKETVVALKQSTAGVPAKRAQMKRAPSGVRKQAGKAAPKPAAKATGKPAGKTAGKAAAKSTTQDAASKVSAATPRANRRKKNSPQ